MSAAAFAIAVAVIHTAPDAPMTRRSTTGDVAW